MLTSLVISLLAGALSAPAAASRPESEAQRLHRKGVYCMEDIERPDCAMDKFEELVGLRTTERELVTDGMLRLVKLYRQNGEPEKIKPLLRGFWAAGVKHRQTGHIPWSTRFVPEDIDMMFMIAVEDILSAPITKQMGEDAKAWVTTCDPHERELLSDRRRWKRAEKEAKEKGKTTIEVIYAEEDRRERARQAREQMQREKTVEVKTEEDATPVFVEGLCPLALALGDKDVAQWNRMVGSMAHDNFKRSVGVVEIPDLDQRIAVGLSSGHLTKRGDRLYSLTHALYEGEQIYVMNTDKDELMMASKAVMPEIVAARRKGRRTLQRPLDKLISEIPRDVDFFFAMTEKAMVELGAGAMDGGQGGLLRALLPRPKGFQFSAVAHTYFGVFMRMPTDNAVKGAMLVSLAQKLLVDEDETDPAQRELMEQLDVAQTKDKRALLLSYVLDAGQVREIFFY